ARVTLRRRVTVMSALVVGATLVLASVVCYLVMRGELRGQVDDSLREQAEQVTRGFAAGPVGPTLRRFLLRVPEPQRRSAGRRACVQYAGPDGPGRRLRRPGEPRLPVSDETRAIPQSPSGGVAFSDARADRVHVRMLTVALPGRGAVQLARSLASVDRAL